MYNRCCARVLMAFCLLSIMSSSLLAQSSETMVSKLLQEMVTKGELTTEDIAGYRMTDHYMSKKGKIDHMYFCQTMNGIDVVGAMGAIHVTPNQAIIAKDVQFVNDLAHKIEGGSKNSISAIEAVNVAAKSKGYTINTPLTKVGGKAGPSQHTIFNTGGISIDNIPAELKYVNMGASVHMAWEVAIYDLSGQHNWIISVSASDGKILNVRDNVIECFDFERPNTYHSEESHQHFNYPLTIEANEALTSGMPQLAFIFAPDSYRVFALPLDNPNFGVSSIVTNPANATASPFGWHDTNGAPGAESTLTIGNNVSAYTDTDANNSPDAGSQPDGTASLDFDFAADFSMAPSTYRPAAVTNLFYVNNMIHDIMYQYGFDELAGNFQTNNYGNGGLGNDALLAESQDGAATCNANFSTPADGSAPRMQMYNCNFISPSRDASFDNVVITHEYGHGISTRLVGGPSVGCLGGAEQMGEGWSDFFSLILQMKPSDTGVEPKGIGTWLLGQGPTGRGIRATPAIAGVNGDPYSTDMLQNDETYDSIKNEPRFPGVHGIGYVWATMVWEMTWGLVEEHGFDTDIYNGVGGNNIALQLVIEGLKMTPCSPGFVDGRNAILAADQALYGGANACIIWQAFAKRGLGYSASQGSSGSRYDGVEAYDVPPSCDFYIDTFKDACDPFEIEYEILVGELFDIGNTAPITLSLSGNPAGSSVAFSVNPVTPGNSTIMTISGAGVLANSYIMTLTGDNGDTTKELTSTLQVFTSVPPQPELISPLKYDNVVGRPTLEWQSIIDVDSFRVLVSLNANLSSPLIDTVVASTSFIFNETDTLTTYYWAVEAQNICGSSIRSAIWQFNTLGSGGCFTEVSTDVPLTISDVGRDTIMSIINISQLGALSSIKVKSVNISHTWIGDIQLALMSPMGTVIELHNNICNPRFENMLMGFDDDAPTATSPCPPLGNLDYIPIQPLATFLGESITGNWTLIVRDIESFDGGTLNGWSLEICTLADLICYEDADGDGYGNAEVSVETTGLGCGRRYVLNSLDCNDNDETIFPDQGCIIAPIPTMGAWALMILGLCSLILGTVFYSRYKLEKGY